MANISSIPGGPDSGAGSNRRKDDVASGKAPDQTNAQSPSSSPISESALRKRQYNASVLQANYEVSLGAKNEPQALIYKTAIDAINKELEADLGENAIERGAEQGIDVSPEATANRIVTLSTNLFELYKQNNPELEPGEQLDRFLEVIGSGIDQGFGEAREILDGLRVLEGEVAENIDKTYNLVQEGLEAFRVRIQDVLSGNENAQGSAGTAESVKN